jgi:polyisoprenoid-binding protein YceI
MKNKVLSLLLIAVVIMSFTLKESSIKIDTQKSKVTWIGRKVTGSHNGTVSLSEGSINYKGKQVTGGSFTIDMTSLKDAEANGRLEGHLKSDDFFSTEKHPKATFVISQVTPKTGDEYTVKGNMTIKGITNEIEFPANIQLKNGSVTAKAKIVVDRTKFDIKFRTAQSSTSSSALETSSKTWATKQSKTTSN